MWQAGSEQVTLISGLSEANDINNAGAIVGLRTPRTLDALGAATEAGLVSADDAEVLVRSWRMVSRVRNAITLVQGKGSDQLGGYYPNTFLHEVLSGVLLD